MTLALFIKQSDHLEVQVPIEDCAVSSQVAEVTLGDEVFHVITMQHAATGVHIMLRAYRDSNASRPEIYNLRLHPDKLPLDAILMIKLTTGTEISLVKSHL